MQRTNPVLDFDHLLSATGGDESLMGELLDMLRRELPERRHRLEAALDGNDLDTASDIAHKLQGSAAYTGAFALEAAALKMERLLKAGELEALADARTKLETAIADLERELETGVRR